MGNAKKNSKEAPFLSASPFLNQPLVSIDFRNLSRRTVVGPSECVPKLYWKLSYNDTNTDTEQTNKQKLVDDRWVVLVFITKNYQIQFALMEQYTHRSSTQTLNKFVKNKEIE